MSDQRLANPYARGGFARAGIARELARQIATDAEREERAAFHAKHGEPGGWCGCWGCSRPDAVGSEREGEE